MCPRPQGQQSEEQRSKRHHGCGGTERRGQVLHTAPLPQQSQQVRTLPPLSPDVVRRGLTAVVQDAAEAAGGAPAADAELGPGAAGRPGQPRHQETAVL